MAELYAPWQRNGPYVGRPTEASALRPVAAPIRNSQKLPRQPKSRASRSPSVVSVLFARGGFRVCLDAAGRTAEGPRGRRYRNRRRATTASQCRAIGFVAKRSSDAGSG
jgi:hypothetical protein